MPEIPSYPQRNEYHVLSDQYPKPMRVEIKLLRIPWIGFQNDLKLVMLLQAVRVDAIATVIRSD